MRRPSPLPQPPAHGAATAAPSGRRTARDRRASSDRDAATDASLPSGDDATAPVIPLTAPAEAEAPAHPDVASHADSPDVGIRQVWGAARARRRALRAEVRRFTARQRRRRAIWVAAAASVLVLALGTIGAAYSPLFAVERITVVGAEQLDADAVSAALDGQLGTPLPLVDDSAVKAELVAFPLVESYTLEARPPHELVVRVVERTPVGLIETRAGYTLVDAAGVALSTTATPAPGIPVLSLAGGADSDAFTAVGRVMRSLPDEIRAQVTAVSATTADDVTLTLGGTNTQVVWGSAEQSARKAVVLQRVMLSRPPADVASYDVSSPDAIVIR